MVESTRASFRARFIHRLHVGVDTLPRVFFITLYIHQKHPALKHQDLARVCLQQSVCSLGSSLLARPVPAGQGGVRLPLECGEPRAAPSAAAQGTGTHIQVVQWPPPRTHPSAWTRRGAAAPSRPCGAGVRAVGTAICCQQRLCGDSTVYSGATWLFFVVVVDRERTSCR